jgi:hypothetical protein
MRAPYNYRAGGEGGTALLRRTGRPWPAVASSRSFDMRAITVSGNKPTRSCATAVRRHVILAALVATVVFGGGCGTPYTRRVGQLDDAYQRGDLSREDYMRFVHEAERWEAN